MLPIVELSSFIAWQCMALQLSFLCVGRTSGLTVSSNSFSCLLDRAVMYLSQTSDQLLLSAYATIMTISYILTRYAVTVAVGFTKALNSLLYKRYVKSCSGAYLPTVRWWCYCRVVEQLISGSLFSLVIWKALLYSCFGWKNKELNVNFLHPQMYSCEPVLGNVCACWSGFEFERGHI